MSDYSCPVEGCECPTKCNSEMQYRVRQGAGLLDEHIPDWFERVDVNRLNMIMFECCVVGQLYGTYEHGVDELFGDKVDKWDLPTDKHKEHGFDAGFGEPISEYDKLGEYWKDEINNRKAG